MNKPKFILFDAGRTLIDYSKIDTLRGVRALMPHITSNPKNHTVEVIEAETNRIFALFEQARARLFEVPAQTILKLVIDTLDIEFDISVAEVERIIWSESSIIDPVPGVEELLDYLNEQKIETGVISNLDFSGYLLKERLDVIFPRNQFKFVIASGDYGFRKPRPEFYTAGMVKCGCEPSEIWYVGDKVSVDVKGSEACGMIPVLYQTARSGESVPSGITVIDNYAKLIKLLEQCK
ncbi:MAG: HAD family hydrolase [Clostridia bacterium]|nr:HAD family hydrolase [Clostridia bacterium]MBQ4574542.1 HAD family hydrolase [Clostridia bacterium]